MNYAAVINGPFSSPTNSNTHYPRLGNTSSCYNQLTETMGNHSSMMQQEVLNSGVNQAVNIYPPFSLAPTPKDPRKNIHIGSKLFVGQVPAMTTEEQLRPVFEPYGELLEVKIMRDPLGRSKGSAWVRYETNEMAMNAIHALHEKHTVPPQTNPLRVQFATPSSVKYQQHQQKQEQQRNSLDLRPSVNPYGFVDPIGEAAQHGGMMMLRTGTFSNIIPSISSNSGNRYIPPAFGGSADPTPMMTGPYTSSTNRFDNVNFTGNKRDFYSSLDQSQAMTTQLYQQPRGDFPTSLVDTQNMYNTQSSLQQVATIHTNNADRGCVGGGTSMVSFDAGHGVGANVGTLSMTTDLTSSIKPGIAVWEARKDGDLQLQDQNGAAE